MRSKLQPNSVTLWKATGTDGYGEESFNAPILIDARWEDHVENLRLINGEEYTSKAVVWTDSKLELGDRVAQGDYTAVADPNMASAYEVREHKSVPSMRTNQTEWRAIL